MSSSRLACAEVAGLASYLAQLSPSRTPAELLTLVDFAYFSGEHPGVVDAYMATLGLDRSIQDPQVRREILDVAAGQDVFDEDGNGRFDEHDLKVFLDAFATSNDLRFDLNGDGTVGGLGTARFDLDVQSPPQLSSVSIQGESGPLTFDELEVTDLEILCYYAYSTLYSGDSAARGILLADCGGGGPPTTTISVLSASRHVGASAQALGDFEEDLKTSDDTLAFNSAANASAAGTSGAASAQAAANTSQQSTLSADSYGNLADITAAGTGSINGTLSNFQGPFDEVQAGSVSHVITDFVVADGTAHLEGQLSYDASIGPGWGATVDVYLGVGSQVRSVAYNVEGDYSGDLTLSADLPPGIYNFTAYVIVGVDRVGGNISTAATATWDMNLTLTPLN